MDIESDEVYDQYMRFLMKIGAPTVIQPISSGKTSLKKDKVQEKTEQTPIKNNIKNESENENMSSQKKQIVSQEVEEHKDLVKEASCNINQDDELVQNTAIQSMPIQVNNNEQEKTQELGDEIIIEKNIQSVETQHLEQEQNTNDDHIKQFEQLENEKNQQFEVEQTKSNEIIIETQDEQKIFNQSNYEQQNGNQLVIDQPDNSGVIEKENEQHQLLVKEDFNIELIEQKCTQNENQINVNVTLEFQDQQKNEIEQNQEKNNQGSDQIENGDKNQTLIVDDQKEISVYKPEAIQKKVKKQKQKQESRPKINHSQDNLTSKPKKETTQSVLQETQNQPLKRKNPLMEQLQNLIDDITIGVEEKPKKKTRK